MVMVMFHLRYTKGGGRFFWHLGLLRASMKYYDGAIFSRPTRDGERFELESWRSGVRVWVNPDYDAIMAESEQRIQRAAAEYRITRAYGPGDYMP